nr:MAG TPA: Major capsid protein [Caudoviricetes sp.]
MFKKQLLPMHLQFFAEPGDDDTPPAEEQTPEFDAENLTDEQLAAIKEKFGFKDNDEIDTIVKGKKSKWQKELEQEKNEAARLAKLSESERQKALIQKEKDDFEKEKAEFRKEQLFVEKGKQLTANGMPADFATRVTGETAEEILEDVKALREEWDRAVEAKVNERLASKSKTRVGTGAGQMTKAEIMAIKDSKERQRMIAENRDLF